MKNWKRIVSALLCVAMLLGNTTTVWANPAEQSETPCPHCGEVVEWVDWDGAAPSASCHVRLPEGGLQFTSGNRSLASGVTMVLDLNGQTMERVDSNSKFFLVNSGAKLVILDSSAEKTGTMIGRQSNNNHAGIAQIYGGDLDIYGGTFKMTETSEAKNGGLFLISTKTTSPTVNIYGGTFYGVKAAQGGVLQFSGKEMNITGGTFYPGSATYGDSLYISSGPATITDATIYGGVYVGSSGSLTVSGKTVIQKAEGGSKYGMKLVSEKTITVGALEAPASIGVTLNADGVFTTEFADEAAAEAAKSFFTLDDASKELTVVGKTLQIAAPVTEPEATEPTVAPSEPDTTEPEGTTVPTEPETTQPEGSELCQHCGEYVVFDTTWTGSTTLNAGHYKLTGETTVSSTRSLSANKGEVIIDLNGQTMKMASGKNKMFNIYYGSKLTILDSSEAKTGEVISYQKADYHAGMMQVIGGAVDIYGGTFRMIDGSAAKQGGLIYAYTSTNNPEINIYGGTFYGSTAERGGILYITSGKLNIEGGTFYSGTASAYGDGIYVNGSGVEFSVSGAPVFDGGMYIYAAKSATFSGTPVIQKPAENAKSEYSLKLASGVLIDATGLTEGASIAITGSGAVATGYATVAEAFANADKFLVSDDQTKFFTVSGTDLALATKSTETTFDCPHCDDENVTWTVWDASAKNPAGGHYYLDSHVSQAENVGISEGTVVLNLNGYTMTKAAAGRMFIVQGTGELVIMDSSADGSGNVISNGVNNHGMIIMSYNSANAKATIYGGNFYDGSSVAAKNGALFSASSGGTMYIKGGKFFGGNASYGGVAAATSGAILEITGGEFFPGTVANNGDTIYGNGDTTKVVIGGDAKIYGGVYISSVASFELTGTPVIQRDPHDDITYSLKTGTPATVTELADGAKIAINQVNSTTKVFTTAFADEAAAKAAVKYFYSDDPAKAIVLSENALALEDRAEGVVDLKDPSDDGVLNILMIGNSFCYYYVQELYGLLMEKLPAGIEEVQIYNMYYSGRTLVTHLARWEAGVGDCEVFRMNKDGRVNLAPKEEWSLEMALEQENWDYISLQSPGNVSYVNQEKWEENKVNAVPTLTAMYGRLYELYPNAQLLWHRTWAFEVGRISGSTIYDEAMNVAYDAGMQYLSDWVVNEFDQDKPYDIMMVNSGLAWKYAREENAKLETSLFPIGGLSARTNVANKDTYQYAKDNPDAKNVGDGYHEGDIGGGQLLNAYTWYMTLTGDGDLSDNTYAPSKSGMLGEPNPYTLADDHLALLKNAAMTAYNETYPGNTNPEPTDPTEPTEPEATEPSTEPTEPEATEPSTEPTEPVIPEGSTVINVTLDKAEIYRGDEVTVTVSVTGENTWSSMGYIPILNSEYFTVTAGEALMSGMLVEFTVTDGGVIMLNSAGVVTGDAFRFTIKIAEDAPFGAFKLTDVASVKNGISAVPTFVVETGAKVLCRHEATFTSLDQEKHSGVCSICGETVTEEHNYVNGKCEACGEMKDYVVIFQYEDGTIISQETYHYGDAVTVPAAPAVPEAMANDYEFDGWDKEIVAVDGDAVYTAKFKQKYLRGDVNNDGEINDADATYLLRYTLFGDGRYPINQPGDMNGDGEINDADATYLLRFTLFGPGRYPLAN